MSPDLLQLYRDLSVVGLRVRRPSRFIFFCGGSTAVPGSLRHYLLDERGIRSRLKASVILAEEANQLYRDSDYSDLISFEEDIAQVSALVLLIAESAGSLAGIGCFCINRSYSKPLGCFDADPVRGCRIFRTFRTY